MSDLREYDLPTYFTVGLKCSRNSRPLAVYDTGDVEDDHSSTIDESDEISSITSRDSLDDFSDLGEGSFIVRLTRSIG